MFSKKKTLSADPDQCTPQQLNTLAQLRLRIRERGYPEAAYDDSYLLRFLCARKFDVEKTLQMWVNFIDWRNSRNIDQIITMEIPEMDEAKPYYPHTWFRTDKKGRPIFIERMGKLNTDKLLKIVPVEKLELYFIRDFERLLQVKLPVSSRVSGHRVNSTCYIMDLGGAAASFMSPKVWELLKIASKIGQDYYPETLGDMFVVNAPMWCYASWNVVKHLMDEKTRTKIHILGSNYKKELLKYIDEENLPDFLGGKATEAEYGPNLSLEQGPWMKEMLIRSSSAEKETRHSDSHGSPPESEFMLEEIKKNAEVINSVSEFEAEEDIEELEIAQEFPLKQSVKNLMMKPSLEFGCAQMVRCAR